jgi:hypothetical protein
MRGREALVGRSRFLLNSRFFGGMSEICRSPYGRGPPPNSRDRELEALSGDGLPTSL